MPIQASALTYRHNHHLFEINAEREAGWSEPAIVWTYNGVPVETPHEFRVDGDVIPPPPPGFTQVASTGWNRDAIRATLQAKVATPLHRDVGAVTIKRDAAGKIVFDGAGLPGRQVDLDAAVDLTIEALERGISDVYLPVIETQPTVNVLDPSLKQMGIKEVVTVGESDFSNSPPNRIHNIHTGLNKFNSHLIQPGETFSFVQTLGPVDGTAGYLRELVIKGDRTVPDYGGGLCQVSSTAYRGVWEAGLPIAARRNHSYIVNHYSPVGTDATVYLPNPDMQFTNNTSGALLMQTHTVGDDAFFIYYGTKPADRQTYVIGPFIWDRTSPPADRVEPTTSLPPGARKTIGTRVPGMKVKWFRIIENGAAEPAVEEYLSVYQARPYFYQLGVESLPSVVEAAAEDTKGLESGDVPVGDVPVEPIGIQ